MMELALEHWGWIVLAFWAAEKVVKLTPSKKDDIVLDVVLVPLFDFIKRMLGK